MISFFLIWWFQNNKVYKCNRRKSFLFPLSSLLHESIMNAVIEQTRVCLLSWLAVPKADNLCWGFLLNFPDTTPNSHKISVNCWFMLCTFWHLSAGFHRFSKHLFQYNLSFWQQPVPVNPWFSFLCCLTISNNVHVKNIIKCKKANAVQLS